jgi:DNA-binding transcriptional LysR family regulator
MEIKWLEDFVSIAETRSFSRSAMLRHVTQPAFSRRIQALEAWLGSQLIDRSSYPTRLTQAGQVFHAQALAMLAQAREARTLLRGQGGAQVATIEFAVPHTLSLTYFPRWLSRLETRVGRQHVRLRALNVHDAVLSLVEGGCDLVMGYHHPSYPIVLDPVRYEMMVLGVEPMSPFSAPATTPGRARTPRPRHMLPGSASEPVPLLSYSADAYLARMTDVIFANAATPLFVEKIYETDMAEGLKAMALAGHGVAFLPHSAVEDAVASGALLRLDGQTRGRGNGRGEGSFSVVMEIRLYRDRLAGQSGEARQAQVTKLWNAALEEAAARAEST